MMLSLPIFHDNSNQSNNNKHRHQHHDGQGDNDDTVEMDDLVRRSPAAAAAAGTTTIGFGNATDEDNDGLDNTSSWIKQMLKHRLFLFYK